MRRTCLRLFSAAVFCFLPGPLFAQTLWPPKTDLTQPQDYALKRISSADLTGANADFARSSLLARSRC